MDNCPNCPAGSITREAIDELSLDSACFRWLTDDHDDPETRQKCREILGRMPAMSHSAARDAIGAAMHETDERAGLRPNDQAKGREHSERPA